MKPQNIDKILDSPAIMVGPLRSGSTMLRLMLDNHPQINFFSEFEGAVSEFDGADFPDLEKYHEFVKHERMMQDLCFDIDKTLNYVDLVQSFLRQAYNRKPAKVIGATIHNEFEHVEKLWPNARYIHITRDPRDVARSCIGMGWVGNVYAGAEYWLVPEIKWQNIVERLDSNRYICVKYEEIVCDPAKELARICDFLGVDFSPKMLAIDKISTYSKPDPKYAEQWRKKLTTKEIIAVESRCRKYMDAAGYKTHITTNEMDPAAFTKFFYRVDNRVRRILFNIDRYGFWDWFGYVIFKRLPFKKIRTYFSAKKNIVDRLHLK